MYHSRALILRKDEWGEADCRLTALTADFGKIRLLAQGARKHGAKLQGHLEPGTVSDISFVAGRNGYRLTTARLRNFPAAARASLPKLHAHAAVLVALDQNLLEEREGARELLATAEAALGALEDAGDTAAVRRLAVWFHVQLAAFLGVFPSPLAPEAKAVPRLLALAARPPGALAAAGDDPDPLEREWAWLVRKLGGAYAAGAILHSA